MVTFVVVHGAWGGGFAWRKLRAPLTAGGHELLTPTLTGLGERVHLASPAVDLATHVQDVVAVIETEDLHDVVLVGHSYGGMVVTGVVARLPDRIRRLIYLDAFVPRDGDSVLTLLPADVAAEMRGRVVDGWRLPPNPLPPDTPPGDVAWLAPRRAAQPFATFTQPLPLEPARPPPRAYIYCTRLGPADVFGPFAERARRERGWSYREIDASHSPHITAPAALVELLLELAEPLTAAPERAAGI